MFHGVKAEDASTPHRQGRRRYCPTAAVRSPKGRSSRLSPCSQYKNRGAVKDFVCGTLTAPPGGARRQPEGGAPLLSKITWLRFPRAFRHFLFLKFSYIINIAFTKKSHLPCILNVYSEAEWSRTPPFHKDEYEYPPQDTL